MSGVNKVILLGNLGKDPETRHLESGAVVASFPVATTEVFYDRNSQKQERTEWHNVELWNKNAEVAEKYLSKGDSVFLEGKIQTDKWQDKEGNDRYTTKIRAFQMTMLGKRSKSGDGGGNAGGGGAAPASGSEFDASNEQQAEDDLPF